MEVFCGRGMYTDIWLKWTPLKRGAGPPQLPAGSLMGGLVKAVVGVGHDVLLEDVLWAWRTDLHGSGRFKTFTLLIEIPPCWPEPSWPLLHRCADAQLLHHSTHKDPAHCRHLLLQQYHRWGWWLGRSARLVFHLVLHLHHLTIMGPESRHV